MRLKADMIDQQYKEKKANDLESSAKWPHNKRKCVDQMKIETPDIRYTVLKSFKIFSLVRIHFQQIQVHFARLSFTSAEIEIDSR